MVATRPIPSRTILTEADVALRPSPFGDGLADPAEAVGMETRVALYAGRPIRAEDIGPPALVERNALVLMRYQRGALLITAEGRAMDRGAVGERIRVVNLSSRQTVVGRIAEDGTVEVGP
ncbi:flagellar basal body P-ring formation chaperone FlgA [Albimonas sp. CAU 1670]|nr:flagellar basal body P-ring formation chaperone FlgA [Albimonas sp. CAU 1670]MDF2231231.1 flagellar basal body P-ring formation chaperone FlgA [Albimonas sp. CAU 1670]